MYPFLLMAAVIGLFLIGAFLGATALLTIPLVGIIAFVALLVVAARRRAHNRPTM